MEHRHTAPLPNDVRALYPFESKWMECEGRRLHYLDEGGTGKPAVLLLHGNPTWSFLYREIIPRIVPGLRAVAPDHLGFGLSDKPQSERLYSLANHVDRLREFTGRLGLKDIILVVQDWGGPIGLSLAVENPGLVRAILVMNTWAWPEPSPFHAAIEPWRTMHAPFAGAHFILRRNILVERALYLSTGRRERMTPGSPVLRGYQIPFSLPASRTGMLAFPRNIPLRPGDANWDRMAALRDGLAKLDVPARLLWGAKDVVFPPENAERFRSLLPKCGPPRLIPHGMHFIQEDAPEEIAEEILALDREARR